MNETWRILVHAFRKQFIQPEKIQRIDVNLKKYFG